MKMRIHRVYRRIYRIVATTAEIWRRRIAIAIANIH